jgi:hypothetical protein
VTGDVSRLRAVVLGACLAAAAAGASAQTPPPARLTAENLLTPLPTGWRVAHSQTQNNVMIQEMIPAHDTVDDWSEMITVFIYRGVTTAPLAASFDHVEQLYTRGCQTPPVIGKRQEISERGYPTGVQFIACERLKTRALAEGMVYKTIKGRDSTYQVQRAWRLTAAQAGDGTTLKDRVDAANAYLRTAYVCDTRDPQRPCPQIIDKQ